LTENPQEKNKNLKKKSFSFVEDFQSKFSTKKKLLMGKSSTNEKKVQKNSIFRTFFL